MIIYLVKSTILLALFLGVYKLFLENEKMHTFNRFFLLAALILGLTAPLVQINVNPDTTIAGLKIAKVESTVNAPSEFVARTIEPVIAAEPVSPGAWEVSEGAAAPQQTTTSLLSRKQLFVLIYVFITLFFLIRFGAGVYQLLAKVKMGATSIFKNATLVLLDEKTIPQSFFKWIFLNRTDFESGKVNPEILEHEFTHIKQKHSLDVLFIELLKSMFWFNPVLYFYKHAIQLNHEFLADEGAINSSENVQNYQSILLSFASEAVSQKITSHFNYPQTKKRVLMIRKEFSRLKSSLRFSVLLPLIGIPVFMFCIESAPESKTFVNGVQVYYSPELEYNFENDAYGILVGANIASIETGSPFTGSRKQFDYTTNKVLSERIYENGYLTDLIYYDKRISRSVKRQKVVYEDKIPIEMLSYDWNDQLLSSRKAVYKYNQYVGERTYNRDQNLVSELLFINASDDPIGLGNLKEWYPGGQLKFEAHYKRGMDYHGEVTLYDEDGNILDQELYEDGKLVDKIK